MEGMTKDIVVLLYVLLPGFVAAWVFYGLTAFSKPSQFERIVQALILSMFVRAALSSIHLLLSFLGAHIWSIGPWNDEVSSIWSVVLAFLIGVLFAQGANTDRVHAQLRKWGITRETSYPTEWYSAFCRTAGYVVLHLKGERRLYGWPEEWPSTPDRGHFSIAEGEWLEGEKRVPLTNVRDILVPVSDVEMVEFLEVQLAPAVPATKESKNGEGTTTPAQ